jgi:predicted TIM-barrel fold metal-dependent hydrolase
MTTLTADADVSSRDTDCYVVVSADSHVGPQLDVLRQYCPRAFLEDFDDAVRAFHASAQNIAEAIGIEQGFIENMNEAALVAGAYDIEARHADMDAGGVAADVLYHGHPNGNFLPLVAGQILEASAQSPSPELQRVGCRIYNRWQTDFISAAPERHAGLAYIPIIDIAGAVEEITWAKEHGLSGVNFPAPRPTWPHYGDPVYEPLWDVCEDLEMPLTTHSGGGETQFGYPDGPASFPLGAMENPWFSRRAIWWLTFCGVFERHPALKLLITEICGGWVPETVRDMDAVYYMRNQQVIQRALPKPPSEYWRTNCYATVSFMSHAEAALFRQPNCENMIWGSDYPHAEGTHPYTRLALQKTFAGIPEEHARAMLGETAIRIFGFDTNKLREIARRIGPTVSELSTPPTETLPSPESGYYGHAFRDGVSWW